MKSHRGLLLVAMVAVPLLAGPATSWATMCLAPDYSLPFSTDPDEEAVDESPPGPVAVDGGTVTRRIEGRAADSGGCLSLPDQGSCGNLGHACLSVIAIDDRTPSEELGYRLELVEGLLPPDTLLLQRQQQPGIPDEVVKPPPLKIRDGESLICLVFPDEDRTLAIAFSVSIRAVDLGGNEGPASESIVFEHPGESSSDGGCSAAGPRAGVLWPLLLAMLAGQAGLRRRRSR